MTQNRTVVPSGVSFRKTRVDVNLPRRLATHAPPGLVSSE